MNEPEWYKTAPEDPAEAKAFECDRRVKLAGLGEDGAAVMRAMAGAIHPAGKACEHCTAGEECDLCKAQRWCAEMLRAIATQNVEPRERSDGPPQYEEVRTILDKFWRAMGRTMGSYPWEAVEIGNKMRNGMHDKCRDALREQRDGGSCTTCQIALFLSGGFITIGTDLAIAQRIPKPHDL